jgi:DNA-binding response OmpR family regulator
VTGKRPILIVEDDAALREALVEQLSENGDFELIEAGSLAEATLHLDHERGRIDLILLDLNLPDGDGWSFCAQLRRKGCHMPIIMLTGASSDADIVQGLEKGANDYICKPFRGSELKARIRAQLRALDASEHAAFTVGPYIFRPAAKTLTERTHGRKIQLTAKEATLLKHMVRVSGKPVRREALLSAVWGYSGDTATHTLETHIYRLRQRIEADPGHPQLLTAVPGGYQLVL